MEDGTEAQVRVRRRSRPVRMLLTLGVNALADFLVPLAVLPVSVSLAGPQGWTSIAIGLSIGGVVAVFVSLGSAVSGPVAVAAESTLSGRRSIYLRSLLARVLVLAPTTAVGIIVTIQLVHDTRLGVLSCVARALFGLTAAWFYTGTGQALRLLVIVTSTQLSLEGLGVAGAWVVNAPLLIPFGNLAGAILAITVSTVDILRAHPKSSEYQELNRLFSRHDVPAAATAIIIGLYSYLPLPIVSAVAPAASVPFAIAMPFFQLAIGLSKPFTQVLQSWVPAAGTEQLWTRIRRACVVAGIISPAYGVVATIGAFIALSLNVGVGQRVVTPSLLVGVVTLSVVASQIIGLVCLTSIGKTSAVLSSSILGAVVGLVSLPLLSLAIADSGAWLALAVAELAVTGYQATKLAKFARLAQALRSSGSVFTA